MKYRTKPQIIEAFQTDSHMYIHTPDGTLHASPGDYIITSGCGARPLKPDVFEQMYELVEAESSEQKSCSGIKTLEGGDN